LILQHKSSAGTAGFTRDFSRQGAKNAKTQRGRKRFCQKASRDTNKQCLRTITFSLFPFFLPLRPLCSLRLGVKKIEVTRAEGAGEKSLFLRAPPKNKKSPQEPQFPGAFLYSATLPYAGQVKQD